MASSPGQVREPSQGANKPILILLGAIVGVAVLMWVVLKLAGGQEVPNNPVATPIYLATGKLVWTTTATILAVVGAVLVGGAGLGGWWWWRGRRPVRSRVDTAQQHLGAGKDIESITEPSIATKAADLEVDQSRPLAPFTTTIGVPIGETLSGVNVYGSWEDMHLDIHGPRMGKSTGRIIPAICEAPGAVLATENKRGNLDHTRLVREFRDESGTPTRRVWVFDPQGVADEDPWWYWNPLSYFNDEDSAEELAQLFAAGDDGEDAKKDPYFDPEGQDLLANLILASALADEPIPTVYERLAMRQRGHEAVAILREHDYPLIAQALNARLNYAAKQADGIWGTAIKMARCLRSRKVQPWITTTVGDDRPQLDLTAFVRNRETLYCLSKEGVGSVGPLVAALTVAATRTAERIATRSPGGRLPVPMLCALDEAANCVRWRDLPKMYSHYGSRGIIIMTILQSWSQGIGVWGERPMKLLESSSNIYIFGGNVREKQYLESLKTLVGRYEREALNVSRSSGGGGGRGGGSVSRHTVKEDIFTEADLASWPRGRMLLFSAGNRPTLVRSIPWWDKPYGDLVRQSLAEYAPANTAATETSEAASTATPTAKGGVR